MTQYQKLPRLQPLELPSELPLKSILNSAQHNGVHYTPECWELTYLGNRYLENIDAEILIQRYKSIVRNLTRLVSKERNSIPIDSFLSSWYWYRKEHQTRVEFSLRGLSWPSVNYELSPVLGNDGLPALPAYPNAGHLLFRFGSSEYMKPMVEKGEVRIGSASTYIEETLNEARTDDELNKHRYSLNKDTLITTQSGVQISPIQGVRYTASLDNYFVLCTSCGYHPAFFNDFIADCYVIIHDEAGFAKRVDSAFRKHIVTTQAEVGASEHSQRTDRPVHPRHQVLAFAELINNHECDRSL